MSRQDEISARARRAAQAFRIGFAPTELVANWRDSASVFFAEFVRAVKDVRNPVPAAYFESGFCHSANPIFAMLDPKALHGAIRGLGLRGEAAFAQLEHEVFGPYVAAWEALIEAMLARFPRAMAEVQTFASKLQAMLEVVRMLATVEGSARGENFERIYGLYGELCAAFREVGVRVEAEADSTANVNIAEGTYHRRRYERYCLSSERLAQMFGVQRETITRWKTVDSNWGRRFRNAKDSLQLMERLAREYVAKQQLPRPRRSNVSFDERFHAAVNPAMPQI